jgi:hypothetical protein
VSGVEEGRPEREPELVLYRCPTPTDVLCPCGAVARRLGKLDLPHRIERVPYRRGGSHRPEIEELTRQHRVPVLIDGDEIVHDSKRILEYLEWRYGAEAAERRGGEEEASGPASPGTA